MMLPRSLTSAPCAVALYARVFVYLRHIAAYSAL